MVYTLIKGVRKLNIGQRLKQLREEKKLTQEDVGNMIGVTKATVNRYETGEIDIKRTVAVKLSKVFDVSPAYIMGWEESPSNDLSALEQYGIKPIKTKKFRMLGEIVCGQPIYCNEEYETYIEASEDINADFCLTAQGDSMINARIFDGDVVFIKEQPTVDNGEIAAVIIENEATLKRVYLKPDKIILRPENPTYDDIIYEKEEMHRVRILGKAVAFQSWVN